MIKDISLSTTRCISRMLPVFTEPHIDSQTSSTTSRPILLKWPFPISSTRAYFFKESPLSCSPIISAKSSREISSNRLISCMLALVMMKKKVKKSRPQEGYARLEVFPGPCTRSVDQIPSMPD